MSCRHKRPNTEQNSLRTSALLSYLSPHQQSVDSHFLSGTAAELRLAGDHILLSFDALHYSLYDRHNKASERDTETCTNEEEVPRKLLAKKLIQLLKTLSYVC